MTARQSQGIYQVLHSFHFSGLRTLTNLDSRWFTSCYTIHMRFPFLNKRITPLIPITLCLFLTLLLIIFFVSPATQLNLGFFSLSVLYPVFFLVFLFCFGIGTLLFRNRFHGMLLSLFVICFLLLRLNDLKHPIFFVILAALFVTTEFFFAQSGKHTAKTHRSRIHKESE